MECSVKELFKLPHVGYTFYNPCLAARMTQCCHCNRSSLPATCWSRACLWTTCSCSSSSSPTSRLRGWTRIRRGPHPMECRQSAVYIIDIKFSALLHLPAHLPTTHDTVAVDLCTLQWPACVGHIVPQTTPERHASRTDTGGHSCAGAPSQFVNGSGVPHARVSYPRHTLPYPAIPCHSLKRSVLFICHPII